MQGAERKKLSFQLFFTGHKPQLEKAFKDNEIDFKFNFEGLKWL